VRLKQWSLTYTSMTKAFIQGSIKAIALGFSGALISGIIFGTAALPFVISASIGFAVGSIGFYREALMKSLIAVRRYPWILRLHLERQFPRKRFDLWSVERMRGEEFERSWVLSNMLVASWLSAGPALEVSRSCDLDGMRV
jgi:hypothetical protein